MLGPQQPCRPGPRGVRKGGREEEGLPLRRWREPLEDGVDLRAKRLREQAVGLAVSGQDGSAPLSRLKSESVFQVKAHRW